MPHTPTMSASGSSGRDWTFSSTISTSQPAGHRAPTVASPSGGLSAPLSASTSSDSQHRDLWPWPSSRTGGTSFSQRPSGTICL